MRFIVILFGAWLAAASAALAQVGYERIGGDYTSFRVPGGDPAVCAARCERDARCRAWDFSFPRTAHVLAMCWLKNAVPPPVANDCCVSGVRGAGVVQPRREGVEIGIDRTGGDYRFFEVGAHAAGANCEAACKQDNRCRAWTYVRAGYISVAPRCYLKDKIKLPRRRPCCISGVLR